MRLFELFGRRAEDYIRDHLAEVNVLGAALLEVVAASRGVITTLAPVDTPLERLYAFGQGGLLASNLDLSRAIPLPDGGALMEVENLRLHRAQRILDQLWEAAGSVCIVDDFNPEWGSLQYEPEPSAFGVGREVYHLLDGSEALEEVAYILQRGDTIWHGVSAVCRPTGRSTRADLSSPEALKDCAKSVIEITCTAYDGEGFVIWTRC